MRANTARQASSSKAKTIPASRVGVRLNKDGSAGETVIVSKGKVTHNQRKSRKAWRQAPHTRPASNIR